MTKFQLISDSIFQNHRDRYSAYCEYVVDNIPYYDGYMDNLAESAASFAAGRCRENSDPLVARARFKSFRPRKRADGKRYNAFRATHEWFLETLKVRIADTGEG